jgi:predicted DNA-binding transcriptional regulator AlpA
MAATKPKATADDARAVLKDQPLVGLTEAAKILGMAPPNVARLRRQGRLPASVSIKGGKDAWFASEIRALRKAMR